MSIYLICFIVSCLFLKLSVISKERVISNIFSLIAIFIPCLLAGLRADNIGTDIEVYVKPMYEAASLSKNFWDYNNMRWFSSWTYRYVNEIEIGFSLLVYIIAKVFKNFSILLMFIQMLIIIPFYKGALYFKKQIPTWLIMFTFYFINYNVSLNLMRQWIAMSFLFYGIKYILEENLNKFIIIVLIASTFHNSAIFGIVFYIIYVYIYSKNQKNIKIFIGHKKEIYIGKLKKVFNIFLIFLVILLCINILIIFLQKVGLSKYVSYINGELHLLPLQILIRLPFIMILLLNWKEYSKKFIIAPYLLTMLIIDLLFSQLGSISKHSWRISIYFSMFNCLTYPSICVFSNKINKKISFKLFIIIYLLLYWIYYFVIKGNHQTIPYIIR